MKRSEALEIVYAAFEECLDIPTSSYLTMGGDACADHILKAMEKAGMLPPPTRTDAVNSSIVYCYYPEVQPIEGDSWDTLDTKKSQLWEPE
jgi:hypothetical protein